MSSKELRRAGILAGVKSGELKLVNAAVMMGLSYRQTKRMAKRYREGGAKGLQHGSAGRESNRKKSKKFREQVLRLVGKKYCGEEGERFGPTLAAEHLASDDHVEVNAQTLRRWMLSEGLWSRARKRRVHRKRPRTERACGGIGADGWKFSRLAGRTRAAWLLDEHGGRRERRYAGAPGE
jgi:transposase